MDEKCETLSMYELLCTTLLRSNKSLSLRKVFFVKWKTFQLYPCWVNVGKDQIGFGWGERGLNMEVSLVKDLLVICISHPCSIYTCNLSIYCIYRQSPIFVLLTKT